MIFALDCALTASIGSSTGGANDEARVTVRRPRLVQQVRVIDAHFSVRQPQASLTRAASPGM